MPQILDGKAVRQVIFDKLRPRVRKLTESRRPPGLAVVLVGDNPASEIYVRNKVAACHELGIRSEQHTPPSTITTDELLSLIYGLNQLPELDGILVQTPLPRQIDTRRILDAIDPNKDVDGFHPLNVGRLVANMPGPRACTPAGIMELLRHYQIPIAGRHAVVVGRSDIVGKPVSILLLHDSATVTICHSRTQDLAAECKRADILIAALGRPAFLNASHIPQGCVVIDVGVNRITDAAEAAGLLEGAPEKLAAFRSKGFVTVGDVQPGDVARLAAAYTPVPGGVGPLTIAMLMSNTVDSAERRLNACSA